MTSSAQSKEAAPAEPAKKHAGDLQNEGRQQQTQTMSQLQQQQDQQQQMQQSQSQPVNDDEWGSTEYGWEGEQQRKQRWQLSTGGQPLSQQAVMQAGASAVGHTSSWSFPQVLTVPMFLFQDTCGMHHTHHTGAFLVLLVGSLGVLCWQVIRNAGEHMHGCGRTCLFIQ
jgi:hypothetical protein